MKNDKPITLLIVAFILTTLFTGCSAIKKMNEVYNLDANGMVIYGTEQQVAETIKQEGNKIEDSNIYKQKIIKHGDKKTIVLNIQTFNDLIAHQLVYNISTDGSVNIKTGQISNKDIPVLYGEKKEAYFEIGGQNTSVKSGGKAQIGKEALYFNEMLVVNDIQWNSIEEETEAIGVIEFQENQKIKMYEIDVDSGQLVKLK